MLYPWGDDQSQSGDQSQNFRTNFNQQRGKPGDEYSEYIGQNDIAEMQGLANAFAASAGAVRGTAYTPKPQYELYPTCGTVHDYAFSRHLCQPPLGPRTLSLVIEWGTEKRPPVPEMEDVIRDVTAGLIGTCLAI